MCRQGSRCDVTLAVVLPSMVVDNDNDDLKTTRDGIERQGAEVNIGYNDGSTALHSAAQYGHLQVTKYLISEGAETKKGDNDGKTALHLAAQGGHIDVTKYYLISQGAKVNMGDNEGVTVLHIAAQEGHLDVIKYLISQGAEGVTALQLAAQEGHLDVTKFLISQEAEVNRGNNEGRTALHSAAFNGHLDVTKYLINEGAEVNIGDNESVTALEVAAQEAEVNMGDNEGATAFQLAAQEGHLDVTKYLMSQGAELNKGANDGRTALQLAAKNGHLEVIKYLISQGAEVNRGDNDGVTALRSAASNGQLDVTKYLISEGAVVNKGDNDGWTALQFATLEGHIDVTKYLMSQGADVNRGANDGRTALQLAANNGHLEVIKYLISQGAEVNRGDNDGVTAFQAAAQEAEINRGDNDGKTALHLAAQEVHHEVTKYLISEEAEVNMGDRNGYTPMHIAALKDDLDIVKVLLEEGALVDVRDANGQTPLHLSSKKGSANSCDFLAKHAKINGILDHRDDKGLTAIHLATQNGYTPVVESLVSHGASLNIQSDNGKTCLHEAIILSDHTSRTEQTKARPQQISEDFYRQELFRKKAALVLYILEQGGKMDIRDVKGKLPIHYATNEVIRQMIFSRLTSIEMITRYRAEDAKPLVTVSAHVGNGGKQIELADLGISMVIPAGAVQGSGSCEITLTSIQDPQDLPGIDSQGGESLACLGVRCEPPNMTFHQPVKIKIPHSVVIVNPDQVKPDIVCRSWDLVKNLPRTSRHGSSISSDQLPYCRVHKRHFELYIGHFAEWWVLIPLEQQVIRHQLMCTPYIPETVERGKEFEVHLQMHADVPGMDSEKLQWNVIVRGRLQKLREIEAASPDDLLGKDVQKIAEKLSIDDFYDLGVALGFQIQQLDAIEYKWLKDRQGAICEMLTTWKKKQPHQNMKEELLSLLKSAETEAEKTQMTG
eukprot:XP_011677994.1 PREDICTED: ankyrin repeat domain-containing protein 50-like [Strongylocentrotus purpuratus]